MQQGGDSYNSRYKTSLCNNFSKSGECNFGDRCKFAHGEQDLKSGGGQQGGGGGGYGGGNPGGYQNNGFQGSNRPQGVCRFFQQNGTCNYGDNCRFSHEAGN